MTNTQNPHALLPLTPAVFHILLALSDGAKHGYVIMQEVKNLSQGQVKMGPGTLYGSIKRMLEAGLIEETDTPTSAPDEDDERRRYYQLTDFGQQVMRAEAVRLTQLVSAIQSKQILGMS